MEWLRSAEIVHRGQQVENEQHSDQNDDHEDNGPRKESDDFSHTPDWASKLN